MKSEIIFFIHHSSSSSFIMRTGAEGVGRFRIRYSKPFFLSLFSLAFFFFFSFLFFSFLLPSPFRFPLFLSFFLYFFFLFFSFISIYFSSTPETLLFYFFLTSRIELRTKSNPNAMWKGGVWFHFRCSCWARTLALLQICFLVSILSSCSS